MRPDVVSGSRGNASLSAHGTAHWHAAALSQSERGDQSRRNAPLHVYQATGPGTTANNVAVPVLPAAGVDVVEDTKGTSLILTPRDAMGRVGLVVGVTHVRRHHEHYHRRGAGRLRNQ